ncbi:MAG: bacteriohemerythrin, partial [Methyloprofundus sp.]|nr:bacteriohemerythrin [Methyloprofundus sp.]
MNDLIDVFPWNKNFDTGIAEIDEQHKVLVKLINQLATHLGNESDLDSLDKTFAELADYAVYHFQSEERIWERYFPSDSSLKSHKETHASFVKLVLELKAEEAYKPINEVIEDLLSFLTHWLAHHILDNDMRMSKVVAAIRSGFSLQSAEQKADKEMSGVMGVVLDTTLSMYDHLCARTLDLKREINERSKVEKQLRLASSVFENTLDGICITDTNNLIVSINPAFQQITGYSAAEVIGKNPSMLSSGKQGPGFYADMWQTISTNGYWQGEIWNRRKQGEVYPELLTILPIVDDSRVITHYIGLFRDISYSKKQQEKLELMAHYDVLTQLPNRILLADRFSRAVAHSKRSKTQLAVCFLDLDDFKPVNDTYGHEMGDQLLIEVATRIKASIRDEDTVSRHGGDEYVLLIGDLDSFTQCAVMLDRIIHSLAQPYIIDQQEITIGASIGVSLASIDDTDLDTLMRQADQAMYQAKLAGRNRYSLFNTEQDQLVIQKNIRLQEIERALAGNEFCLYYQPKVN